MRAPTEALHDQREAMILRHTPLARAIAHRYARRGLEYDDIVQAGYIGLINAVDRYDPSRGVPLERYAARTIEGEIMHLFRDRGWAVRVPRSLQELSRRATKARVELGHRLGRQPTVEEVATEVDEDVDAVMNALAAGRAYHAEHLSDGDEEAADGELRAHLAICDEPGFSAVENRAEIEAAVEGLEPRERMIVSLRFFDDLTQSEIADRMGISQMHVSRLLRASLEAMAERVLDQPAA
jgi:RNA polymerase sigma-B factor